MAPTDLPPGTGCRPAPGGDAAVVVRPRASRSAEPPVPPMCAVRYSSAPSGRLSGAGSAGLVLPTREEKPCRWLVPVRRPVPRRRGSFTSQHTSASTATSAIRSAARSATRSASWSRRCWSIPSGRFGMTVREDQDVIKLDFRHTVTRPDLAGLAYQQRPGQYLADVLRDLRRSGVAGHSAQRQQRRLVGQPVRHPPQAAPVQAQRADLRRRRPACPRQRAHAFFLHGPSGYQIVDIKLHGTTREAGDTSEMDLRALRGAPPVRPLRISADPARQGGLGAERGAGLGSRSPVRPRRVPPGHPSGHPGVRPDARSTPESASPAIR